MLLSKKQILVLLALLFRQIQGFNGVFHKYETEMTEKAEACFEKKQASEDGGGFPK